MKKLCFINFICFVLMSVHVFSQAVGIGSSAFTPDASAMLEVQATNKGLLIPRVALTQTTSASPVTNPATSLLVYNTATVNDVTPGYYYWDGTKWVKIGLANHTHATLTFNNSGSGAASGSTYNGSSPLTISYNTIGAVGGSGTATQVAFWSGSNTLSSNSNLYWDNTNNRLGIGTSSPAAQLHTTGTVRFANYASGVNGAILRTDASGNLQITNFTGNASDVLLGNGTFGPVPGGGGSGTVTSIGAGTPGTNTASSGLTFSSNPITSSGTIALSNTGVTPGTYGNSGANIPNITVDAQGRLTAASNRTLTASDIGAITSSCGTANYIPKMASASNISCSQLYDNATAVQIGSTTLTNCKFGVSYSSTDKYGIYVTMPGYAIYGNAAAGGGGRGVIGDGGEIGVMGSYGTYTSSNTWGKLGFYESTPTWYGVYGYSFDSHSSGWNIAVRGRAGGNSVNNVGVFADAGSGTGTNNYGVYADAFGFNTTYGVYATGHDGITNYGVYASGSTAGVLGISSNGGNTAQGVRGEGNAGAANGDARGVVGLGDGHSYSSTTAYGVKGHAQNATYGYGVYGSSSGCTTGYGVYCSGNGGYTGSWSNLSDIKFKKNIADYENALEKIMLLKPRTYEMKIDEYPYMGLARGQQIGFIAQEMETIFPNLVETAFHPGEKENDPPIEYKAINYIGLIPVLVKATQELNDKISELSIKIEQLTKENNELKKKLNVE